MSGLAHLQGQLLMEEQAVNLWPVQYVRRRGGVIRGLVHSFENLDLLSLGCSEPNANSLVHFLSNCPIESNYESGLTS